MTYKLKLQHKQIGFEIEQSAVCLSSAILILNRWKYLYGKKFKECVALCNGLEIDINTLEIPTKCQSMLARKIVNLKTKDVYDTVEEASIDLKVSKDTIRKHLNRGLADINYHKYLVAWE